MHGLAAESQHTDANNDHSKRDQVGHAETQRNTRVDTNELDEKSQRPSSDKVAAKNGRVIDAVFVAIEAAPSRACQDP